MDKDSIALIEERCRRLRTGLEVEAERRSFSGFLSDDESYPEVVAEDDAALCLLTTTPSPISSLFQGLTHARLAARLCWLLLCYERRRLCLNKGPMSRIIIEKDEELQWPIELNEFLGPFPIACIRVAIERREYCGHQRSIFTLTNRDISMQWNEDYIIEDMFRLRRLKFVIGGGIGSEAKSRLAATTVTATDVVQSFHLSLANCTGIIYYIQQYHFYEGGVDIGNEYRCDPILLAIVIGATSLHATPPPTSSTSNSLPHPSLIKERLEARCKGEIIRLRERDLQLDDMEVELKQLQQSSAASIITIDQAASNLHQQWLKERINAAKQRLDEVKQYYNNIAHVYLQHYATNLKD